MQLSKRLATVADCVPLNTVIADIGTDHAYVPVYLVLKGVCPRAVAGDLNSGPVKSARETVRLYGLEHKIDVRRGDGLDILEPGEVDVVIMAGMGGLLISRILENGAAVVKQLRYLLLQPNNNAGTVRSWLVENGWGLVDEYLIEEKGKYYPVILAEQGRGIFTRDIAHLEFGPCLLEKGGSEVCGFLEKKKKEYQKVLHGLSRGNHVETAEKKKEIAELLQEVKEALKRARKS